MKNMFLTTLAVMILTGAATSQGAQCDPAGTQAQMTQCAYDDFQRSSEGLNASYTLALKKAAQIGVTDDFEVGQRHSVLYRDYYCEAEAGIVEGGSLRPLIWTTCRTRLTDVRTADLSSFTKM